MLQRTRRALNVRLTFVYPRLIDDYMRDHAVAHSRALYFVRAAYTINRKGKECCMQYTREVERLLFPPPMNRGIIATSRSVISFLYDFGLSRVYNLPLASTMISFFLSTAISRSLNFIR